MPNHKALSGAQIVFIDEHTVAKKGGARERDQGIYCHILGSEVCPKIVRILPDGYTMERLADLDLQLLFKDESLTSMVLINMLHLLKTVWHMQDRPFADRFWFRYLADWLPTAHENLHNTLADLYDVKNARGAQHYIHGDPTLSNVMLRKMRYGDGKTLNPHELVLCDPLRARDKIPGYKEVDLGKMLQSMIGWEHVLTGCPMIPERAALSVARILIEECAANERVLMFWLAVHALRIKPYAKNAGRDDLSFWSTEVARIIDRNIQKEISLCDTLTTLMALSRSLETQS